CLLLALLLPWRPRRLPLGAFFPKVSALPLPAFPQYPTAVDCLIFDLPLHLPKGFGSSALTPGFSSMQVWLVFSVRAPAEHRAPWFCCLPGQKKGNGTHLGKTRPSCAK